MKIFWCRFQKKNRHDVYCEPDITFMLEFCQKKEIEFRKRIEWQHKNINYFLLTENS
jgi:hypothetical protein